MGHNGRDLEMTVFLRTPKALFLAT